MKTINDFKKGQRVSLWDDEDEKRVYGKVSSVNTDAETVSIKWEDLSEVIIHKADEFENIEPA